MKIASVSGGLSRNVRGSDFLVAGASWGEIIHSLVDDGTRDRSVNDSQCTTVYMDIADLTINYSTLRARGTAALILPIT